MARIINNVHDTFRRRNAGKVEAPFNSKPATDDFHVDRSRLGFHEEWDPEARSDYGGKGKYVPVANSIMDNVRGAMGGIGAHASFRSVHELAEPTKTEGDAPCCTSDGYRPRSNPLMRRKGD